MGDELKELEVEKVEVAEAGEAEGAALPPLPAGVLWKTIQDDHGTHYLQVRKKDPREFTLFYPIHITRNLDFLIKTLSSQDPDIKDSMIAFSLCQFYGNTGCVLTPAPNFMVYSRDIVQKLEHYLKENSEAVRLGKRLPHTLPDSAAEILEKFKRFLLFNLAHYLGTILTGGESYLKIITQDFTRFQNSSLIQAVPHSVELLTEFLIRKYNPPQKNDTKYWTAWTSSVLLIFALVRNNNNPSQLELVKQCALSFAEEDRLVRVWVKNFLTALGGHEELVKKIQSLPSGTNKKHQQRIRAREHVSMSFATLSIALHFPLEEPKEAKEPGAGTGAGTGAGGASASEPESGARATAPSPDASSTSPDTSGSEEIPPIAGAGSGERPAARPATPEPVTLSVQISSELVLTATPEQARISRLEAQLQYLLEQTEEKIKTLQEDLAEKQAITAIAERARGQVKALKLEIKNLETQIKKYADETTSQALTIQKLSKKLEQTTEENREIYANLAKLQKERGKERCKISKLEEALKAYQEQKTPRPTLTLQTRVGVNRTDEYVDGIGPVVLPDGSAGGLFCPDGKISGPRLHDLIQQTLEKDKEIEKLKQELQESKAAFRHLSAQLDSKPKARDALAVAATTPTQREKSPGARAGMAPV